MFNTKILKQKYGVGIHLKEDIPPKDLNRHANWQTVKDLWLDWVAPRCEYMHWY